MSRKLVLVPSAPTETLSDAALVAACGSGDTEALGALFDRRQGDVRRFLFRLAGTDARDIDDLVQMTFLEALRASPRFRGGSAVKTWLFGIATNIVRHHVRSDVRKKTFLVALAVQPAAAPIAADAAARQRQQLTELQAAVLQLPLDLRTVFVMCDVEGTAGVEAASSLGIPEGTVWRRLHDARRRLRAIIGEPS